MKDWVTGLFFILGSKFSSYSIVFDDFSNFKKRSEHNS